MKRLYRSRDERMIAGVAGGIAHYLDIDPTLVRVAFVLSTVFGGWGLALYIALAIIMPMEPMSEAKPATPPMQQARSAEEQTRRELQESRVPESIRR